MCTSIVSYTTYTHTHTHTTDADEPQPSVNSTSPQDDGCPNIDNTQIPGLHLYLPRQEVRERRVEGEGGKEGGRKGGREGGKEGGGE